MSLHEVWQAASGSPFTPAISKDNHFVVGFTLLLIGLSLTTLSGLNRSLAALPLLGLPASLAFGFGAVYTICAVGVYPPIFTAVSGSARQLSLLLRCIGFWRKAEVQITSDGLRISVEESRTVQGITFLEKTLFSSYTFSPSYMDGSTSQHEMTSTPSFQINLFALLEVLQIFGLSETTSSRGPTNGLASSYSHNPFNTPALTIAGGTCRISYPHIGAPLSINITESGVTTTCDLNTYESSNDVAFDIDESIPLQRDALTFKMIMRSSWLHDAITELASENPTTLVLTASQHSLPLFALEGSGGPFGDATVEFKPDPAMDRNATTTSLDGTDSGSGPNKKAPQVSEVFSVSPPAAAAAGATRGRIRQLYKFEHIQKAARAMGVASKVCIRCDRQGVLSLQFMIELSGDGGPATQEQGRNGSGAGAGRGLVDTGRVSFVDFRFVPLVDDEDEDEEEDDDAYYGEEGGGGGGGGGEGEGEEGGGDADVAWNQER